MGGRGTAGLTRVELDRGWRIKDFDPGAGEGLGAAGAVDDGDWIPARVPGDVHSDLIAAGRLPDIYFDRNVEQAQWVEDREWWFRTSFRAPDPPGPKTRDVLTFEGLDTYAAVYLNGQPLGENANMFRPALFDVTGRLDHAGTNNLAVRFDPVRSRVAGRDLPGQWGGYGSERVFARKRQCQFSWDWAPRLVNVGIWREVRLERFDAARLLHPFVRTLAADEDHAAVAVGADVDVWDEGAPLELEIRLSHGGLATVATVPVSAGRAQTCLSVPRPALWWPSGYGAQPLYDLHMQLRRDDTVLDGLEDRVGLRTVELDRTPDPEEAGAESFTFRINGVRIFAKGANWIPLDCLSGRMDRPRYEELLDLLVEAHGNMLRVWGGGQYEKDDFYRLADERGILVWHDFMFACARYPDDPDFIAEVRAEAEHQVRRLRNRTCVVLWAGNNENDWIEDASNRAEPGHDFPGKSLYHRHLPEIVRRLDPSRPYWPSSPYGGDDHNGEQAGDRHNWHVWHGGVLPRRFGEEPRRDPSPEGVSYRHYLEDTARFASEFGMHASPVLETLRRNLPASELSFGSEGLLFRNKDTPKDKGNALMLAHTGLPRDLDEYIDLSMICQAEGLKLALEHYRRRKFHCSGALFWQWNDCWPGLSWSVLDYYAFPKASYFFVKRAYAPVLASFAERPDGAVEVWLTNDLPAPVDETLTWTHATFDGQVLDRGEVHAHGPANASMCVARVEPGGGGRRGQFLWLEGGDRVPYNRHFFAEVKDLVRERPAVSVEWERSGDALVATLVCERHAYFVNLFAPVEGTRYSDNWFDLFPDKPRRVSIRPPEGARLGPEGVEVAWR